MNNNQITCQNWYDKNYEREGFTAQRLYPNEELLRFFGNALFKLKETERKKIKVLELGCGSCSNLWMVAHEGFKAYGIDISQESISLGRKMLEKWRVKGELQVASMTDLPYKNSQFDVVIDVFSANCLNIKDFQICLKEVARVLKKNGNFFSYTPSIGSNAFKNYLPANKIDKYTLNGVYRKTSPYYGNFYPFRFTSQKYYRRLLEKNGFETISSEKISRTYRSSREKFEFITIVGRKIL